MRLLHSTFLPFIKSNQFFLYFSLFISTLSHSLPKNTFLDLHLLSLYSFITSLFTLFHYFISTLSHFFSCSIWNKWIGLLLRHYLLNINWVLSLHMLSLCSFITSLLTCPFIITFQLFLVSSRVPFEISELDFVTSSLVKYKLSVVILVIIDDIAKFNPFISK